MRESHRILIDDVRLEKVRKMISSRSFSDLISILEDWDVVDSDPVKAEWNGEIAIRQDGMRVGKEAVIKKMNSISEQKVSAERPKQFQRKA